ncbi:MAG TPA: dienelactone hydrolase family protein [Acidimicrobiales bacterium]|nr:dienelactone hydrolase family protein [Acidimicrobiales bacterium]
MTSSSETTIDTADGPMPAFVATPDGDAKGGVVVVQEAFGVTGYIEDVARRLADAGWYAVAPAFFHRQGSPVIAYDDLPAVMPVMQALTAGGITTDLDAAFEHLHAAGFDDARSGIVGFCMGGSVTLYAATIRRLGAAVTFYGGGVGQGRFGLPGLAELAPSLGTPWLGLYGDLDQGISVEEVESLRTAAAKAAVATEVVRYPDADHGFHCDGRPAVFNATAAADGWARTLAWFDRHIGG